MPRAPAPPPGLGALLSKSEKGGIAETALDTLTLLLSRGTLHLAQLIPDDKRIDRIVFRPQDTRSLLLQIKSDTASPGDRYLNIAVIAPQDPAVIERGFLLATTRITTPPLIGDIFLVPFSKLGPVPPGGAWKFSPPLDPTARSKWNPYRFEVGKLATVFHQWLDGQTPTGPPHVPPPRPRRLPQLPLSALSFAARGRILENTVSNVLYLYSDGKLHLARPLVDDFGLDFSVTGDGVSDTIWLQVKGDITARSPTNLTVQVRENAIPQSRFNFIVVVEYRADLLGPGRYVWVIRTDEAAPFAERRDGRIGLHFSTHPRARDAMLPWRYRTNELAAVLETAIAVLNEEGRSAVLPTSREDVMEARGAFGLVGGLARRLA